PINRTTTNGTPVTNFTIACSRKFKDNKGIWREDVCYIGVVAWYKLAVSCFENLLRGSAVMVEGELQSKSWKLDNGFYRTLVEIKAKRIQFLNRKNSMIEFAEDDPDYDNYEYDSIGDGGGIQPLAAKSDNIDSEYSDEKTSKDLDQENDTNIHGMQGLNL
ncbi:MAG: single-stranded DNA-binding protein, partial [bacterium]|nr:single-stranded DNA-binding protein [bacterium]